MRLRPSGSLGAADPVRCGGRDHGGGEVPYRWTPWEFLLRLRSSWDYLAGGTSSRWLGCCSPVRSLHPSPQGQQASPQVAFEQALARATHAGLQSSKTVLDCSGLQSCKAVVFCSGLQSSKAVVFCSGLQSSKTVVDCSGLQSSKTVDQKPPP